MAVATPETEQLLTAIAAEGWRPESLLTFLEKWHTVHEEQEALAQAGEPPQGLDRSWAVQLAAWSMTSGPQALGRTPGYATNAAFVGRLADLEADSKRFRYYLANWRWHDWRWARDRLAPEPQMVIDAVVEGLPVSAVSRELDLSGKTFYRRRQAALEEMTLALYRRWSERRGRG